MRRKYRRQEPPFSVTIELTQGCNLRCSFCAIAGIQEKQGRDYKFMTMTTIQSIADQVRELGWSSRVGFAMRGEPTMHPDYIGMVAAVRERLPRAHMVMLTNAGGLLRSPGPVHNVCRLFDAGLNVLGLDHYEGIKFVPKVVEAIRAEGRLASGVRHRLGFKYFRYPENLDGNPHMRRPRGTRMLVEVRDPSVQEAEKKIGNHAHLTNFAGTGAPKNDDGAGKRCHQPFRQIAIEHDGHVAICCGDWRGAYSCGNVVKDGLEAVWQSNAFGAAREMLIRGRREMEPCLGCDSRSYRVGLLPDLKGAGKLHKPDEQTAADIQAALDHGPHTKPVLRPWEIKP